MTLSLSLETDRLILRPPQMSDFDAFAAYMADQRAKAVGGGDMDRVEAWKTFSRIAGSWQLLGFGLFVVEEKADGKPIGSIGPWKPLSWPEGEIGWSIWTADAEGKGIAFEAAQAARDYAFSTLGWTSAVSYIDPDNARSRALAERLGAKIDPNADRPHFPEDNVPCLVYRYPNPQVAA